jgi:hypothetical protein
VGFASCLLLRARFNSKISCYRLKGL